MDKKTFAKGATINRPSLFVGENYPFWKVRMQNFLEFIDRGLWDVVLNGPFIPTIPINDVQENKPSAQWTTDESRRAQYDMRARNITPCALTLDEFYRINNSA